MQRRRLCRPVLSGLGTPHPTHSLRSARITAHRTQHKRPSPLRICSVPAPVLITLSAGADRPIQDWRNCDDGSFKYAPRMGDAVLFWGTRPNGEIDPHSLHGGCPVKKGEKWVATKWIRSRGAMGY